MNHGNVYVESKKSNGTQLSLRLISWIIWLGILALVLTISGVLIFTAVGISHVNHRLDVIQYLTPSAIATRLAAVEAVAVRQDSSLDNHRETLRRLDREITEREVNFRVITVGRSRITVPCDVVAEEIDEVVRRAFGPGKNWHGGKCVRVPLRRTR